MRFIVGLLLGTLSVLAVSSWSELPFSEYFEGSSFGHVPKRTDPVVPVNPVSPVSPVSENKTPGALEISEPLPVRSVTIEPLPADPAPRRTPKPGSTQPLEDAEQTPQPTPNPIKTDVAQAETEPDTAVIWKPFHSEVSAAGFARRLSVQLGYPFRALREGPAKYHVVFDYGSQEQRELLREQVKALTGFSVI